MKIKVYSIAVDGKCGTVGGAYATEREAWQAVLDAAISNKETRGKAQAMLDDGKLDFHDFLHDHTDGLTTWQVDEAEIEVRIVDELVTALEAVLKCNHELGAISRPVANEARAILAKTNH